MAKKKKSKKKRTAKQRKADKRNGKRLAAMNRKKKGHSKSKKRGKAKKHRNKKAHRRGGFSMAGALKRKQRSALVHRLLAKGYNTTDAEHIASRAMRKWDAVAKKKGREAAAHEKGEHDKRKAKEQAFANAWANIGKMAGGGVL